MKQAGIGVRLCDFTVGTFLYADHVAETEQAELFSKFGLQCIFRNKWPCGVSYFKSLLKKNAPKKC